MSPVRIGRLQQKCISIYYLKKKKRGSITQCQIFLEDARTAESEEQDHL